MTTLQYGQPLNPASNGAALTIEPARDLAFISAAKVHVLQIAPIKARLGDKWGKLSQLVHRLFEKSLKRVLGPADRFIKVDELSYVATFQGRSPAEAAVLCAAVARDVCELLFGDETAEVLVRTVIGRVPENLVFPHLDGFALTDLIERTGKVTITKSGDNASLAEALSRPPLMTPHGGCITELHDFLGSHNRAANFFPVWDLLRRTSNSMLLGYAAHRSKSGCPDTISNLPFEIVGQAEILLLKAAGEYAERMHAARQICAVGTTVSFATLAASGPRARFLSALKSVRTPGTSPLLLKIESVPTGVILGRLAELITMVKTYCPRVLVEFAEGSEIPPLDLRLGAAGLGLRVRPMMSEEACCEQMKRVCSRAETQKAFTFATGLSTPGALKLAITNGVRFGVGRTLSPECYSGAEPVPHFPLVTSPQPSYVG